MSRPLHPEAQAILDRLLQEKITALYHFTNVENLPGICRMGALYSKQILEDKGLLPTVITGGNPLSHSLDVFQDNWGKVSLNLTPHTPMVYHRKRAQHLCFLLINPEVATWSGVIFTDTNAAKNDHKRGQGFLGLNNIRFDAIHAIPFSVDNWHRFVQAEVLVPVSVPLSYVFEVGFVSSASMDYTERLCSSFPHPQFSVIPQLFTDSPKATTQAIGFSYVHDLTVLSSNSDKNMIYLTHEKNKFSIETHGNIAILATVRLITGTQAKVSLMETQSNRERFSKIEQLPRGNEYKYECHLPLKGFTPGIYLVRYYLDDVCWATTQFEIIP